ncbi:MAG TPA: PQQ-dependent sugar dehydrogenase [Solirubrobacteraceae bacterium]|jgi:hypothetical protein
MRTAVHAAAAIALAGAAASPPSAHAALGLKLVGRFAQPVYVTGTKGRTYVVERRGRIRELRTRRVVLDIRREVLIRSKYETQDQRGLLSAAFASPSRFYVFFVDRRDRIRIDALTPQGRRTLLTIDDAGPVHHGGQLQLGPDGLLYVSVGFGNHDDAPQDPDSPRGKILRLDPRAENPVPEVYASGLRNPYRFSFDPRGRLIVGDVGGDDQEEITILDHAGANLGWPVFEGRKRLGEDAATPPGYIGPRWAYSHTAGWCSIVAGYVHRGRYFYGDVCNGWVYADGRRTRVTVPYLVSFGTDSRGRLYAASFRGGVYRVVP